MKFSRKIVAVLVSISVFATALITGAVFAVDEAITYEIKDLEGKYKTQGRTEIENGAVMLDWTAAGIEWNANCSGDVTVTVNATRLGNYDVNGNGGLYFTVYVDGVMQAENLRIPATVDASWTSNSTNYPFHITSLGESTFTIAKGLAAGDHTFAIYNQTEANMGAFGVKSITMNGSFLAPPAEKDMFVEFVGDSITAAHGILGLTAYQSDNAPLYEDATRAWAYLTAQTLDADWSVIAQSGITAIDGIGWGGASSVNMQDVYPYQRYYSGKTAHDFANSREPDVIVLGLGTNDCWTWNGTGGVTLTEEQKVTGFKQMLTHLRDRNPNAKIVWVYGMMDASANTQILQAVSEMGGVANGYYSLELPKNRKGAHGHPDLASQTVYAEKVSAFITNITTPVEQEDWEVPTEMPAYQGGGKSDNPYIITNGAELYWAVNNVNSGVYFKLANDIVLNEMTVDAANGTVSSTKALKEWYTGQTQYFKGYLDGDNHVIKGLYIDEPAYTGDGSRWDKGYGLVSHAAGATFKNLGIENAYLKVDASGTGTTVAAFVGSVGNNNYNVAFENCYVGEDVYISGKQAAGFIGSGGGGGLKGGIKNCYSLATIKGTEYYGAFYGGVWSGGNNTFTNCYANTKLFGNNAPKFVNCFATATKASASGLTIVTADNMKGDNGRTNLASLSETFCLTDSGYPKLKSFVGRGNEWSGFRNSNIPGDGNADSPKVITTAEQLAYVIKNGGSNLTYRLANDIYLNDITKFDWATGTTTGNYALIQWSGSTFNGTFDGDYHVVYGLYVNETIHTAGWSGTGDALFPSASNAVIKNVGVDYAYIQATNNASAIVGYAGYKANASVTVDTCYAGSKVNLRGYNAGGIYGSGDANFNINSCYSLATLYGAYKTGGISGGWWGWTGTGGSKHYIDGCYTNHSKVVYAGTTTNCYVITASGDAAINATGLGDAFVRIGDNYPTLKAFTDLPENIPWNGLGDSSYIVDGRGTAAVPYLIENAAQLAHVVYNNGGGKYYQLVNDIYVNDVSAGWLDRADNLSWITSPDYNGYGAGDAAGKENSFFNGTIDGNGYVVYGLYYPKTTTSYASALVPLIDGATIKNIGVKDAYISAKDSAAGIVGITRGTRMNTISNCFADETVFAGWYDSSSNGGAAGIVGYTSNSVKSHNTTIKDCWSAAKLHSAKDPNFRSNGIIGKSWSSYYTVENCYSIGYKPFAATYKEVGSQLGVSAYKNVYTDSTTAANANFGPYTQLTTAQLTGKNALSNLAGFSADVWYAVEGKTPFLRAYGTAICDVNEDGAYEKNSDTVALRTGLIGTTAKNGDVNKDGEINICDLVAITNK